MTPGTYIRLRRQAHGLSQLAAALAANFTQARLSKVERDEILPAPIVRQNLADAIGFPIDILEAIIAEKDPRICISCGCSEYDPCGWDGIPCHWIGDWLCSAHMENEP